MPDDKDVNVGEWRADKCESLNLYYLCICSCRHLSLRNLSTHYIQVSKLNIYRYNVVSAWLGNSIKSLKNVILKYSYLKYFDQKNKVIAPNIPCLPAMGCGKVVVVVVRRAGAQSELSCLVPVWWRPGHRQHLPSPGYEVSPSLVWQCSDHHVVLARPVTPWQHSNSREWHPNPSPAPTDSGRPHNWTLSRSPWSSRGSPSRSNPSWGKSSPATSRSWRNGSTPSSLGRNSSSSGWWCW